MTDIPDAAIEAAAEARWLQAKRDLRIKSRSDWATLPESTKTEWRHDTRAAIEAAMPAIREAIAQAVDEFRKAEQIIVPEYETGLRRAANIVRGAQ